MTQILGIRHGEAMHNVLGQPGLDYPDTTLTVKGMAQALSLRAKVPIVDLVLVSPLTRTLQTASLIFPESKIIALDELMEYPQNVEICNQRSPKDLLIRLFPNVDFQYISADDGFDVMDADTHLESQIRKFKKFAAMMYSRGNQRMAAVTHSSWLKKFVNGTVGDVLNEIPHCSPVLMNL